MPKKYSFTKEELEELYINQKLSMRQTAKSLSCSRSTIRRRLRSLSIPIREGMEQLRISKPENHYPTKQEIQQLCADYENGLPMNQVAEGHSLSLATVKRHLHANKTTTRKRSDYPVWRKYFCNNAFFNNVDSEQKAYWLGFIAADGCVKVRCQNRYTLYIGLKYSDRQHLQTFLNHLGSDNPVNISRIMGYKQARIEISSKQLCQSLIRLGITPRKSLTLEMPPLLGKLTHHYIRGYFDGDGSVSIAKNQQDVAVVFTCGSLNHLATMQQHLHKELNLHGYPIYQNNSNNVKRLTYTSTFAKRLLRYIYSGATVYLPRKWPIARAAMGCTQGSPLEVIPRVTYLALLNTLQQWIFERDVCEKYLSGLSAPNIANIYNTYRNHIYRVLENRQIQRRSREECWILRKQRYGPTGSSKY